MSQIIGISIIVIMFAVLFIYMAKTLGLKETITTFVISLILTAILVFAVLLISIY